jgi:hypothetical protein
VGVSRTHIEALIQVLTAAKLKPVSFSLGLTALQSPAAEKNNGVLALVIGETGVGLQITCHGGVAALRGFEGSVENEGSRRTLHAGAVSREARITLGQLPAELRAAVRRIRIFGPNDLARQLADEMELGFEPMGLTVEVAKAYTPNEFGVENQFVVEIPPDAPVSAAFSLAARYLTDQPRVFELLPPKPTALEQFVAKYSSGKLRSAGAAAAAILVIVGGIFLYQQIKLMHYRSQWNAMSQKVGDLTAVQNKIQRYQAWYDTQFRALTILRQVTLAFPESGSVTAKSISIHGNTVECSGTASDSRSLLQTIHQLPGATIVQIRGASPMQFTFDFLVGNGTGGQP